VNINFFNIGKERNKDIVVIIPVNNRLIINNYEESLNSTGDKADKNNKISKSDKEAFIERQKADEPKKK